MKEERNMAGKGEAQNYKQWLSGILSQYKFRMMISMLIVVIRGVILLLPSVVTQQIIDVVLPQGSFSLLLIYAVLLVAIPVTVSVLIVVDLFIDRYILKIMSKLRCDIYNGIQYRPLQWLKKAKLGDIVNCMLDETEDITNFGYFGIGSIIWFNTTIIAGMSLMIARSWMITLGLLVIILVQVYITNILGEKHKENSGELIQNEVDLTNRVLETISGIQFVKSTASEMAEYHKVEKVQEEKYKILMKQRKIELGRNIFTTLFVCLTNLVIYLGGGFLVIRGQLTIGALVAINSLFVWIQPAIFGYQSMYIGSKKIAPSLDRIYRMIYPVEEQKTDVVPKGNLRLKAEDICFNYEDRSVLEDLSFSIEQGECVSIIGASGSGKSTLINLLLGFEQPVKGEITLGGIKVNDMSKEWLRKTMVCVPQTVSLRAASILDNILFHEEKASDEQIQKVLEVVCLKEWIEQLPKGLQTFVGEQSLKISGGERQRICMARAILRKPKVLILDEATSALDPITERKVISNLKEYLTETTLILVTHRMLLIALTDKTIRIESRSNT